SPVLRGPWRSRACEGADPVSLPSEKLNNVIVNTDLPMPAMLPFHQNRLRPRASRSQTSVKPLSRLQSNQKISPVKPGQTWSNLKYFFLPVAPKQLSVPSAESLLLRPPLVLCLLLFRHLQDREPILFKLAKRNF